MRLFDPPHDEKESVIELMNMKVAKPSMIFDFYIDRRSPIGNPYPLKSEKYRDQVCDDYQDYFNKMVAYEDVQFCGYLNIILQALRIYGRVRLFCWCNPRRCHGDTIVKWLRKNI